MLARLLPKLKTVPVVVAVPKHPTLKLTAAGLAFKPNPPKLNPPAVVFPAPSPPNPAASAGRQQKRENNIVALTGRKSGLEGLHQVYKQSKALQMTVCTAFVFALPVLVEPKLNPVAGTAAVVVAAPKLGAVRATKQKLYFNKTNLAKIIYVTHSTLCSTHYRK